MGKLFKVALGLILIGFGLFAVFSLLSDEPLFGSINEEDYTLNELVYSVDDFEGLDFDLHNRDVIFRNSADNQLRVTYYTSEKDMIVVNTESDSLKLTKDVEWVFSWFTGLTYITNQELFDVYVDLPSDAFYNLEIDTSNGKLEIENYSNLGTFDFDTSNGTITLTDIVSNRLNLETSNGPITLQNVSVTGAVDLYTSNGRINLTDLTASEKVYFKTSNGSINLSNIDAPIVEGKTSNSRIDADRIVSNDITLESSNGDVELTVYDDKDDYSADLTTSNGSRYYDGVKVDQSLFNTSAPKSIKLHSSNGSVTLNFNN